MTYDWEKKVTRSTLNEMSEYIRGRHGFVLAGIAVCNPETGQAALISVKTGENGVIEADYRQDILGDATAQYNEAVGQIHGGKESA